VNPVSSTGPQYLPAPLEATGCRIQCSALPISTFLKNVPHAGSTKPKTALEAMEGLTHTTPAKSHPQTPSTIRQRRPADAFLLGKTKGETKPPPRTVVPQVVNQSCSPRLISISAHSDAMLDRFAIRDEILLRLHVLLSTVHSSRWEAVLTSPEWNLTRNQASTLAAALVKDILGPRNYTLAVVKVCHP